MMSFRGGLREAYITLCTLCIVSKEDLGILLKERRGSGRRRFNKKENLTDKVATSAKPKPFNFGLPPGTLSKCVANE